MLRDEEHARGFLKRHQDKLLFGSDCSDAAGKGEKCIGANTLAAVRRLAPDPTAVRKILHDNATRVIRIS
jgi:predicted TIM-barrel fold metal-dependent hydrolase